MKNMEKTINQRIADTGIFVFSYNPQTQLFTYSRPFTVEEAKLVADETNQVIASQYGNTNGLRGGLQARNNELINMNTLKGILANRALMRRTNNHQWLPTIKEGIQLQAQGLFSFGVLIDFGLALYDNKNPDEEIAQVLSMTAKEKGYAAPVLASFKSLDLAEFNHLAVEINETLEREGYVDQAVQALKDQGIKAKRNAVNLVEVETVKK